MRKRCEDGELGWGSGGPEARGKGIKEKRKRQNRERRKRGDAEGLRRKKAGTGSDGTEAGMRKRGGSEEPEGR